MKITTLTAEQLKTLTNALDILQDLVPYKKVEDWTFKDTKAYKAWDAVMDVIIATPHEGESEA